MAATRTWEQRVCDAAQRPGLWLAVVALLLALQIKWWWQPCPDAVTYLSIARHMAAGELQLFGSPHVRMAPGYPLLIAPAFLASDKPFLIIAVIHFALALLLMAAVYLWFRRLAGPAAAPLTALVMVSTCFWHHYRQTVSELAFMAALMWAVYALDRLIHTVTWRQTAGWAAVSLLLTLLATYTRQVGMLVLCGFSVALLVRAARREVSWGRAIALIAVVSAPLIAAVLALVLWDHARALRAGGGAKSYAQYFTAEHMTPLQQIAEGVRLRSSECGRLLIPGMYKAYARTGQWLSLNTLLYTALTVGLAWAWWKKARQGADLLVFMLPAYVGLYIVWPFDQGGRYLLPMLPVLVLCLWGLLERLPRRRFSVLFLLVVAQAAVSLGYWARDLRFASYHGHWPALAELAEPLRARPGATVWREVKARPQWESLHLMLAYEINRPLAKVPAEGVISPDVRWLVVSSPITEAPGFAPRGAACALTLLERDNRK